MKRGGQRKPTPGDVFALRLEEKPGLVCFQFVGTDPVMGELVLVFPPIRANPVSLEHLRGAPEQFFIFTPLTAMLRAGLVERLGEGPAVGMPAMRAAGFRDRTGKPLHWWIYSADGQKYRVDALSPEQERLSMRQFVNAVLLYERVASGWTPATAEAYRLRAAAREQHTEAQLPLTPNEGRANVIHYSYFKTREAAERAAAEFRQRSYEATVSPSADPASGWLMKVDTGTDTGASDQIEQLTVTLNGEYDGWETKIANGGG